MKDDKETTHYKGLGLLLRLTICKKYSLIKVGSHKERSFLTNSQGIKLLSLLLKNRGQIVRYATVAKYLEINCYSDKYDNIYFSEYVKYAKERLQKILKECGMPVSKIKSFILTITKQGYMVP